MQISLSDGWLPALRFSLGCLIVEVIYVRISLVGMNWVSRQRRLFRWLEWITVAVIAALAVSSFITAAQGAKATNPILSQTLPRFWLGIAMSAVNPVQIPFWFGWSTVLFARGILHNNRTQYNLYITGIGIGTFIGNAIFIFGGRWMAERLARQQHVVNYAIGGIFALTAIIQFIRILQGKGMAGKIQASPDGSKSGTNAKV